MMSITELLKKKCSASFFFRRENANDSDDISEAKKNRPF